MPRKKALILISLAAALSLTACGSLGSIQESEALEFGYILPETGDLSHLGRPLISSTKYAIHEINDAGGVLGSELPDVLGADEAGDAAKANSAADRLLGEGVDAIIGAAASDMTLAIIDRVAGAETVQCSGSNTAPALNDYPDNGYYFRTAPTGLMQSPVLTETVVNDGHTNIAILYRADDYGQGISRSVKESLEQQGVKVSVYGAYDAQATGFDSIIDQVMDSDAQAVLLVSFKEGSQFISGFLQAGMSGNQMYGTDGLNDPTLEDLVSPVSGDSIAGFTGTAPAVENKEFRKGITRFNPDLAGFQYATHTYDCVNLVALAAEAAGSIDPAVYAAKMVDVSKDGEKCGDFATCRDLLADGENIDYEGASGPINWDSEGNITQASIMVYGFDNNSDYQALDYVVTEPQK